MNTIFLAAGTGSRIQNKVEHKCLIKIGKKKSLIENNIDIIKKFCTNITIVTGYKREKIKRKLKRYNLNFVNNNKFKATSIVYSLKRGLENVEEADTVVSYSDILLDQKVFKILTKKNIKKITIPVLKNWKDIWNIRKENIYEDAEELVSKKNKLIKIGDKIKDLKKVKYQFMGILFIPKNQMSMIKKLIANKVYFNYDITKLLNTMINKKFEIEVIPISCNWYEFDKPKDIKLFKCFSKKKLS